MWSPARAKGVLAGLARHGEDRQALLGDLLAATLDLAVAEEQVGALPPVVPLASLLVEVDVSAGSG